MSSSPSPSVISGAVLLGHGSREPGTVSEIQALCARMAIDLPDWRFAHAFLNQDPRIEAAAETLVSGGCKRIRILPLLVFTGRHMIEDVPAELEKLRVTHPDVEFTLDPYLFRQHGFAGMLADALKHPSPEEDLPA